MIRGLGTECVGVAGRTLADGRKDDLNLPFKRLRSRNLLHRALPKPLRRFSPLRPAALLASYAKELGADRVLCHYGTVAAEYSEAWDLLDLPLFVYFHGYDLMFDLRDMDGKGAPAHPSDYKDQIRALSKRAILIANSSFSQGRLLEAGVDLARIRVNYLGVMPKPEPVLCPAGRPTILYVGRFVDCKGPDQTILAFDLLRKGGCDAELVMVGGGPLRSACLKLAAESQFASDIHLTGVEDHQQVERRLASASVFSMHSMKGPISNQEEAFGVAFLDAMSVGLPIVTGNSGGVPEIVKDGVTGFLFEPGDIEGHASRLKQLIENQSLARQMGMEGWKTACSEFSQRRSD